MNKVEKVIKVIKEKVLKSIGDDYDADKKSIQTFTTRNVIGDSMETIYNENGIQVDVCWGYEYIEVFGLSNEELKQLMDSGVCY